MGHSIDIHEHYIDKRTKGHGIDKRNKVDRRNPRLDLILDLEKWLIFNRM